MRRRKVIPWGEALLAVLDVKVAAGKKARAERQAIEPRSSLGSGPLALTERRLRL
jgi:hypothetical protein